MITKSINKYIPLGSSQDKDDLVSYAKFISSPISYVPDKPILDEWDKAILEMERSSLELATVSLSQEDSVFGPMPEEHC